MKSPALSKVFAECIGTYSIVFAGCGAIMTNEINHNILGHMGISLTFGLIVMVMIYATGHISGAHFNPAVTLAFSLWRKFSWRQVVWYVAAQCLGAILAALTLKYVLGDIAHIGSTDTQLSWPRAFLVEALLSAMLMFVIMAVATDTRSFGLMAGVSIGAAVACCALFAGPLTGASMNPARSLGPAIVGGHLDALVLYLVAPICGAVMGGGMYTAIRCDQNREVNTIEGCCS